MRKDIFLLGTLICLWAVLGCRKENSSAGLFVESDTMEIPYEGGVFYVDVTSSLPSKAIISYDSPGQSGWILMLPSVLKANGILELRVDPFDDIDDRKASITIRSGDEMKTITITQRAKAGVSVSPRIITTTESAKTFTITVASKANWTVRVNDDAVSWCTLMGGSGIGTGSFTVSMSPTNEVLRKATITVETEDAAEIVTVQQGQGVEIDGIIWSHYNVGEPNSFVSSIDARGLLYQYDSKIGYPNMSPNVDNNTPLGYKTGWTELGTTWTPENNPSPTGWRIPTNTEIKDLMAKGFAWIEPEQSGFAIPGAIVGIPASEVALVTKDNTRGGIFWPQTGFRRNEDGWQENWWEACITSITRPDQNWDRYTYWIIYNNSWGEVQYAPNYRAYPVRCVRDVD